MFFLVYTEDDSIWLLQATLAQVIPAWVIFLFVRSFPCWWPEVVIIACKCYQMSFPESSNSKNLGHQHLA